MKSNLLQVKDLAIGYGSKLVADKLSANIPSGELICLLGSNGTGKSTLIRSICGFQPILSGSVLLNQLEVKNLGTRELSKLIAVVLTDRVVVPNATVEELVGYGRSPYTGMLGRLNVADKIIVQNAISECGIAHKKDSPLSSLSDGERQKAFIAKALAQDTPLIILDEPTAFLDLSARVEIMQLLRNIANSSGKSILMSTHDLDLALQLSDRLWLLQQGGPLLTGSPEDLLLQNAFQSMFKHKGIEFDNKTGLFTVKHSQHSEMAVKGHGFEYVLLRRAFARNGVKTISKKEEDSTWLEVCKNGSVHFKFYREGTYVGQEDSIEDLLKLTLKSVQ
ncbi:ABC transporter ATP-binding protein [Ancylomarina sp. 16SWW S1-10-2]|uniref:ABC transporter ATP-binding protein n=1 Tax=Ancylomarina sp. 16SWW S1-10-2 TaxID=2499681 RepID=UPI00189D6476|nr:ABC transporter ATP-binding protein [Ancylomarina sp. 16SWW S1-10-2]